MSAVHLVTPLMAVGLLTACSPALNWREVRLPDAPLNLLFPCKPETVHRTAPLDGVPRPMTMLSCEADGLAFALTYARLDAAAAGAGVLGRWRERTLDNLAAGPVRAWTAPQALAGLTEQAVAVQGRRPDGRPVAAEFLWFVSGPWVFQGSILTQDAGPLPTAPATAFWTGIRVP